MTIEKNGVRFGTFPDLIMTLDTKTARPIVTAEMAKGQQVAVITVPKEKLRLSSTMSNQKLIQPIEKIINKKKFEKIDQKSKNYPVKKFDFSQKFNFLTLS